MWITFALKRKINFDNNCVIAYICVTKAKDMKALIDHIENGLKAGGASYVTAVDSDGGKIKIRVSNHSCNDRNNGNDTCLSFITESTVRNSGQLQNITEWVMEYNESNELWEDKNYQSIEEILSDYCLVGFYYNDQFIKF